MKTLLVLVAIIGVLAVVGAVWVGSRTFDGVVVDSPYERGLAWDEERRERHESGLEPRLLATRYPVGKNEIAVAMTEPAERVAGLEVAMLATRPHTDAQDRSFPLAWQADRGLHSATVDLPTAGRWQLVLSVREGDGTVTFNLPIEVVKATAAAPPESHPGGGDG